MLLKLALIFLEQQQLLFFVYPKKIVSFITSEDRIAQLSVLLQNIAYHESPRGTLHLASYQRSYSKSTLMKVRIQSNTMRFRLKQPEVNHFQQHGQITEVTEFGPEPSQQLRFRLKVSSSTDFTITFEAGTTTIYVPQQVAQKWTSTELVGFDANVDTGYGREIVLLVEKDFICQDRPGEDNVGAYPNPKGIC